MLGFGDSQRVNVHEVGANELIRYATIALVGVIGISAIIQFMQSTQLSTHETSRLGSYGTSVYGR